MERQRVAETESCRDGELERRRVGEVDEVGLAEASFDAAKAIVVAPLLTAEQDF